MKTKVKSGLLIIGTLFIILGCSENTSIDNSNTAKNISGVVVDGLIKDAIVCLDINKDGSCSTNEPRAISGNDGKYTITTTIDGGEYSIISIGGIDTATNEKFDGVLQEIVVLQSDTNETTANLTPLTTIAAITYEDEKKQNNATTLSDIKDTIAKNLGLTKEDISKNPLLDTNLFATTQKVVQVTKLLATSIQKDKNEDAKNQQAFNTVMEQVAKTIKENTTSEDLNVSKVVDKLKNIQYQNTTISISNDIATSTQEYANEVKKKIKDQNSNTSNLTDIQKGLETYTKQLQNAIIENETNLTTIVNNVKSTTTNIIINQETVVKPSQTVTITTNVTPTNDTTPTIVGTISATLESSSKVVIYNGTTKLGNATINGTSWSYTSSQLIDGVYSFLAVVENSAGVQGTKSSLYSCTIDTINPSILTISKVTLDDVINSTEATAGVDLTGTTEDGTTVTVNGQNATVNGTTWSYNLTSQILSSFEDGNTILTIVATDRAGNKSTLEKDIILNRVVSNQNIAITTTPFTQTIKDKNVTITGTITSTLNSDENIVVYNGATKLGNATINGTSWSYTATALADKTHSLTLRVEDSAGNKGNSSEAFNFSIDTTPPADTTTPNENTDTLAQKLTLALQTGDSSNLTLIEVQNQLKTNITNLLTNCGTTLNSIYKNGIEQVTFPSRSAYFESLNSKNIPFHITQSNGKNIGASFVGIDNNNTRYSVLGTNIFAFSSSIDSSFDNVNTKTKNSTLELMKWLLKLSENENIVDKNLTIVITKSSSQGDFLQTFITANSLNTKWTISYDTTLLDSGAYDIYIAPFRETTADLQKVRDKQKPMIIFNEWYEPKSPELSFFDLKWIGWGSKQIGTETSIDTICKIAIPSNGILDIINNFETDGYKEFNHDATDACVRVAGIDTCYPDKIFKSNTTTSLQQAFMNGAEYIKTNLQSLDKKDQNVFELDSSYDILKLSVMLGDKYREGITYPMSIIDTATSPTNVSILPAFYKALFADYSVHYARSNNILPPTLGNFDTNPKHEGVSLIEKNIILTPTIYDEWTATGLYGLAGKPITITRTDTSDNVVEVRFNMLRSGSTQMWNPQGYSRPKFVTSNPITLEKGKTYTISSPYGGPIYVYSKGVATNAQPFNLTFQNVAQHPYIDTFDATSLNTFTQDFTTSGFDWIDIKTPYVEIHSTKEHMMKSLASKRINNDLSKYISDIKTYLVDSNLNLAGFKGEGLSLSQDVINFCTEKGLDCTSDIHRKPQIQHINVDQASCGAACSGNPYDTSWELYGTQELDHHEFGHNLQVNRMKIYGGKSLEVSNHIHTINASWKYLNDKNLDYDPECYNRLDFNTSYTMVQEGIKNNTVASESHPLWTRTGLYDEVKPRLNFYLQLMFLNGNSSDIFTKLYLMNRIFEDGIKSTEKWELVKNKLGFGSYSLDEAKAINGNDFMCVALSYMSNKNHIAIFNTWGVAVSDKAKAQITSYNLSESIPLKFYYQKDTRIHKQLPSLELPLDGTTTYPSDAKTGYWDLYTGN